MAPAGQIPTRTITHTITSMGMIMIIDHDHRIAMGPASWWSGTATDFGKSHSHRLDIVAENRPKLPVLLALGIAGGLLPDPAALALLLGALSSGKVLLGLVTVVVFSIGFATTLVVVGIVAAKVGEKVLDWLASIWMIRLQIATSLLIVGMGVVLTVRAISELAALPPG